MKAGLHIRHMSGIWSTTRLKSVSFHLDLNHLIQTVEVTGQKSTFIVLSNLFLLIWQTDDASVKSNICARNSTINVRVGFTVVAFATVRRSLPPPLYLLLLHILANAI